MHNIVVLDGFALNPGDLSWQPLRELGKCVVHDRTPADQVAERCSGAEIVLTNKTPLDAAVIGSLPALRYIGVMATGHNVVDSVAAASRGIVVTNVPTYGTKSVAQHTIALLLELTNHVGRHGREAREGVWSRSADWCYWSAPLTELDGLTLGIVGRGRIGDAVARIAESFGMKVISTSRKDGPAGLRRLMEDSDVISLHCPLTPETKEMINAATLAYCKPTALLINTSRGGLIREADLAAALVGGRIAGAGVDVLSTEPPSPDNPLLHAPNCLITPHVAWASLAARRRLLAIVVDNIRAFLAGKEQNRVN